MLASYLKGLNPQNVLALGPVPTRGEDLTFTPDQTKGRTGDVSFVVPRPFTIHAEKCPNRRGVELVLEHFQGELARLRRDFEAASPGASSAACMSPPTRSIPPSTTPASLALRSGVEFLVVQDTLPTPLAQSADVVLAGATFAEKAGCLRQCEGPAPVFRGGLAPPRRKPAGPRHPGDPVGQARAVRPGAFARRPEGPGRDAPGVRPRRGRQSCPSSASSWPSDPKPRTAGPHLHGYSDPWMTARADRGDRPGEASRRRAARMLDEGFSTMAAGSTAPDGLRRYMNGLEF